MQCGPSCLQAVLKFYEEEISIKKLIEETKSRYKWHDWDYLLGLAALKKGLKVVVHTRSTSVFDPSWWKLSNTQLISKLKKELDYAKKNKKKRRASWSYTTLAYEAKEIKTAINFLKSGGAIDFNIASAQLIQKYIHDNTPVMCAFNQQILHKAARIHKQKVDDIKGAITGHMIVVIGYNKSKFKVADPGLWYNRSHYYWVSQQDLIDAIVRYDGNLIAIKKK